MAGHWKHNIDHETHLGGNWGSMYHGISNLVKPFFAHIVTPVKWTSPARSPIVSYGRGA